jgi:hypothetical protein
VVLVRVQALPQKKVLKIDDVPVLKENFNQEVPMGLRHRSYLDESGPGPRPKDPSEISFDDSCFKKIGEREEYFVVGSMLKSAPERFTDKRKADAYAKRTGRVVSTVKFPVMKRIKWNNC